MPHVQFLGSVHPSGYGINLTGFPGVTFRDALLDLVVSTNVYISDSKVEIHCDLNQFDESTHLAFVSMVAYDAAKAVIDLVAFKDAVGLTFVMDRFKNLDGVTRPFILREPALMALSKSTETDEGFNASLRSILTNQHALLALRDVVEAIDEFHEGPIKSGRCVDSIRAYFVPPGGKKEDGWAPLRMSLRVSKNFLDVVMNASKGPRHGDRSNVRKTMTLEVTRNAWILMDRFIEYHKRGKVPLPESDFPEL